MSDLNRQAIATLEKERDTLMAQRQSEMSDENRDKIWMRIDEKQKIIDQYRSELNNRELVDFRDDWRDRLIEIDFKKAKDLIEKFKKDRLDGIDRRYALLLLDNTIAMEGELILQWLEHYLRSCGSWTEPFKCGFTSTANKDDFIRKLADKCAITMGNDMSNMIAHLRAKFCTGEIFFIKIEIPTDDCTEFLGWFVQEFWQQLTQGLDGSFAVVAAISIDCQFKGESLPNEVFSKSKLDGQKIMRLALQNWTQEDIVLWLRDHSGLGKRGFDMAKFKNVADGIWKVAKGKPDSTRNALVKNLERLLAETT